MSQIPRLDQCGTAPVGESSLTGGDPGQWPWDRKADASGCFERCYGKCRPESTLPRLHRGGMTCETWMPGWARCHGDQA